MQLPVGLMKVVLAEKPSVAREIASFLRAKSRRDGFFEGDGYQVTWALGHLVTLKEPDDYDPALKKWTLDPLPIIPKRFELKLVGDRGARKQFSIVKGLFRSASELICATDAGREGELIFRYILTMTGCTKKPFKRLWLSSLTGSAIRSAFNNLRPGSDYDNLYAAAKCRSEADWIVGMNGTRNYTVRLGDGILWSVGRVQTPVLAMIVRRDDQIRTFRPEPFWELMTRYRKVVFKFTGGRFSKEDEAKEQLTRAQGQTFTVTKVDRKQQRTQPPQLYDLTELQRDMNRRFGMSAADTLKIAQSLYERKLITYPRTDSRYLGSDMKKEVPGILEKLSAVKPKEIGKLNLRTLRFTGRIVNDKKVGDHHAIIPTGGVPGQLSSRDRQVYDAIATRLIAVFYPPCVKEVTTVDGVSNEVPFRAKGIRVVDPGWTELYPRNRADDKDDEQELPSFTVGERGPHEPFIKQGETSPPRPYTENTLLGAMETAGKLVDEELLRETLKEKGLGTPATRAAIIETLLKRNYIERIKKTVTATDLGRYLIALVHERNLKSPELTGYWESRLREIEAGRLGARQFMAEIVDYANQIVRSADEWKIDQDKFGECPQCGRPVIQGKRGFGCSGWRDGCSFVLWPTYKDCELSVHQIRELLQRGTILQPSESANAGKVILALTETGDLTEIPVPSKDDQRSSGRKRWGKGKTKNRASSGKRERTGGKGTAELGSCPLCSAKVIERPKSYSCGNWKNGCQFVIWKTMAGKRITVRTARTLLSKGETSLLRGFKSKAGKPFDARLKLVDGKVKFEFDS